MADYLEEYKAYYLLRVKRYEGNPDYQRSYEAGKAMYDAIASCSKLEDFQEKLGNLNEKVAVAVIMDEYSIRLRHYEDIKETVRAEGCRQILEKASAINNVAELITMINDEEGKTSLAITADSIKPFDDFLYLENLEIYSTAIVPDKYRNRYSQFAEKEKQSLREAYLEAEKNLNTWQPGWKFDYERIEEDRHRRLLPYPDDVIKNQIELTKQIRHAG